MFLSLTLGSEFSQHEGSFGLLCLDNMGLLLVNDSILLHKTLLLELFIAGHVPFVSLNTAG